MSFTPGQSPCYAGTQSACYARGPLAAPEDRLWRVISLYNLYSDPRATHLPSPPAPISAVPALATFDQCGTKYPGIPDFFSGIAKLKNEFPGNIFTEQTIPNGPDMQQLACFRCPGVASDVKAANGQIMWNYNAYSSRGVTFAVSESVNVAGFSGAATFSPSYWLRQSWMQITRYKYRLPCPTGFSFKCSLYAANPDDSIGWGYGVIDEQTGYDNRRYHHIAVRDCVLVETRGYTPSGRLIYVPSLGEFDPMGTLNTGYRYGRIGVAVFNIDFETPAQWSARTGITLLSSS